MRLVSSSTLRTCENVNGNDGTVQLCGVVASSEQARAICIAVEKVLGVKGLERSYRVSCDLYRLPPLSADLSKALATTPLEDLLKLPMLQLDQVSDALHAYQLSKRENSLRVMYEAVRWGERGARVNTISPGIIITPLAKDELSGPRGAGYRKMIDGCRAKRAGTPDEVANVAALLMGPDGAFITGSGFLMDGGVTASYWFGSLAPQ
jgi:NAD(P)-dependent dehydrogenase (short-subunit alcohol dehydrogenase family)